MYEIELEPPRIDGACECCSDHPVRLTRFVTRDGDARGVYFGLYSNRHAEPGVHVLLSLGSWREDSRPEDRSCFYFQVRLEGENSTPHLLDAVDAPWEEIANLGVYLSREQALSHPLKQEVFALHDLMIEADVSIRGFLDRSRAGDTSQPLEVRYDLPDALFVLSEEDRAARGRLGGDVVSLDGDRFFVRALLPLQIEGRDVWDVASWCEIAQQDFERLSEVWSLPEEYGRFSCAGAVANDCSDIDPAGFLGSAVEIGVRDQEQLPVILSSHHASLHARLTEPWPWPDFQRFAVERGFL